MSVTSNIERYKGMKGIFSADEQRNDRVEKWKNLSKNWRQDELAKRRNISFTEGIDDLVEDIEMMDVSVDVNNNVNVVSLIREEWIRLLRSDYDFDQLAAALKIERLLQRKHNERVILNIICAGLVPRFFELIQNEKNSLLQLTIASILADVTTENVQAQLPPNSTAALAQLLKSNPTAEFKMQIITILGNFAGDSGEARDAVLSSGAFTSILNFIEDSPSLSMLRGGVWAVSNLCSAMHSTPDENIVKQAVPILTDLIKHDDREVIGDSCWALAYICDKSHQIRQEVIERDACKRLVDLLKFREWNNVVLGSIRVLGALVASDDQQTQAVIDSNAIPSLHQLLQFDNENIQQQVCWVLSNIGAGPHKQIQSMINANVYSDVLRLLSHSTDLVEVEASWVIKTSINFKRTTDAQIDYFFSIGTIETLCSKLTTTNVKLLRVVLRTLRTFFFITEDYDLQFLKTDALKIIKNLQKHKNWDIKKIARDIVSYFPPSR